MLIELPIVWIVVLNVAGWPVIQFGLAWLFTRMPVTWFNASGARAWEGQVLLASLATQANRECAACVI